MVNSNNETSQLNSFNINNISLPKIQSRLKNKNDPTQITTVNGCMKIYNANTNQNPAVTILFRISRLQSKRELSRIKNGITA